MTKLEQFFYDNAGYSYNPKTETEHEGRVRGARLLARAAVHALENGYEVGWGSDEDGEYCTLWSEGVLLASLSGIEGATSTYRRVVEAELALEASGLRH